MANRIMGITVEIGGDTTKLQTALKSVNAQIKSTQQQLKDVDKLLKLESGNTELLAQKQKLLANAVGETKEKFSTLKTAAEQANTALANGDISQEQYIWFTSKEYNFEDNSEPEYLKFLFSCLTKERIPYSSEAEWRLFSDFSELEEGENGKKFDFLVKPRAIVMGRNIERNLDFRDRVREYSSKSGIGLLKAQDIKK